jgi:hypothetical protein
MGYAQGPFTSFPYFALLAKHLVGILNENSFQNLLSLNLHCDTVSL